MTHLELATLCQSVYHPDGVVDGESVGGTGAFCSVIPGMMGRPSVVVFRGSCDPAGWIEDLDLRLADLRSSLNANSEGRVHHGFSYSWQSLRRQVAKILGSAPAIFTGHSYGGALATLAAADWPDVCIECVTFASPRVGDTTFSDFFAGRLGHKSTRYVYRLDPVPLVMPSLYGYRHVSQARWNNGTQWQDGYDLWSVAKLAARFVANLVNPFSPFSLLGNWRTVARQLIADHGIGNYVEALAP